MTASNGSVNGSLADLTLGELVAQLSDQLAYTQQLAGRVLSLEQELKAGVPRVESSAAVQPLDSVSLLTGTTYHIEPRAGTAAAWSASNPVLLINELGIELDTGKAKLGDGSSLYADLPYWVGGVGAYDVGNTPSGGQVLGWDGVDGVAVWEANKATNPPWVDGPGSPPVAGGNTGSTWTLDDPTTYGGAWGKMTANLTLTLPAPVAGVSFFLRLDQDSTGGRTLTWGGTTPTMLNTWTLRTAASSTNVFLVFSLDGTAWDLVALTGVQSAAQNPEHVTTVTYASSITLADPTGSPFPTIQRITLAGNPTISPPAATAGASLLLELIQDSTGSRVPTFSSFHWGGAGAPTLSTGSGKRDFISLLCTDGSTWQAFTAGLGF